MDPVGILQIVGRPDLWKTVVSVTGSQNDTGPLWTLRTKAYLALQYGRSRIAVLGQPAEAHRCRSGGWETPQWSLQGTMSRRRGWQGGRTGDYIGCRRRRREDGHQPLRARWQRKTGVEIAKYSAQQKPRGSRQISPRLSCLPLQCGGAVVLSVEGSLRLK